ncbi:hypothetical protein COCCADRAFT_30603 [Bipolaris zeicola 26-R-13]|uniref:Uncharacterized protein n=1 Tax=Cochliobolus carbonum (strain 26-R-13) TaxID=930089 RepID=W6XZ92_COCC2|nr:uncharacterized protein COCCADRAFT_30603 [Bipolaris zeicola 26-R-13]EUC28059.1 hypothetical protein COCCADRAFT_30603 [Bipolaris zeicola 26-R-13]
MQRGGGQIPIGRGQKLPDRPQLPMIGNRGGQPQNPAVPERPPAYLDHASLPINPYPPHPIHTLPPNLVGVQGKQWCYVTCGNVTLNTSEENFQRKKINPPGCFIGDFKVTRRNLREIPSYLASHQSSMANATSIQLGYSGRPDPSGKAIFMFTFSKTIRSGNQTRYDYAAPRYGVIVSDMDRNGGQQSFDRDSYPLYQFKPVPRENSFSEVMILADTRRLDTTRGELGLLACSFQLDRGSDEKTPPDVQWHLWHLEKPGDAEPYGKQVTEEPAPPELQGTKEVTDDEYKTSRINNNNNNAHNPNSRNVLNNNGVNNNNAGNNDSEGFDILNQSGDVQ